MSYEFMNKQAWMVKVKGRDNPTVMHGTFIEAQNEAQRLCIKTLTDTEVWEVKVKATCKPASAVVWSFNEAPSSK